MPKVFSSGRLNTRVDILVGTPTRDPAGQPIMTWAVHASVWASVIYPSGVEAIRASANVSTLRASVRIRYRPGITTAMRVRLREGDFDIQSSLPKDTIFLDLVCERTA